MASQGRRARRRGAQNNLGALYSEGNGIAWGSRAGLAGAQANLGAAYYPGDGLR